MSFNDSNLSVLPLYSHPSASIHLKWHSTEQSFPIQPYSSLFIECAGNRLMRDRGQRCHSPFYDSFVWIQHLHWCPLKYFDLSALWPHLFVTYQAEHILSFLTILYNLTSKIKKWKFFIIETFYIHLLPMSINFPVILSRSEKAIVVPNMLTSRLLFTIEASHWKLYVLCRFFSKLHVNWA